MHFMLRGSPRDLLWAAVLTVGVILVSWVAARITARLRHRDPDRADRPRAAVPGPRRPVADQPAARPRR